MKDFEIYFYKKKSKAFTLFNQVLSRNYWFCVCVTEQYEWSFKVLKQFSTRDILIFYIIYRRPGSVVGIATAYGLDGPGIESRGMRFSAPVQNGPEAHPASCTMGTGSSPEGKERDADPSPPSSAEVKNRVELYLYSP
jgi:hypothetical protein